MKIVGLPKVAAFVVLLVTTLPAFGHQKAEQQVPDCIAKIRIVKQEYKQVIEFPNVVTVSDFETTEQLKGNCPRNAKLVELGGKVHVEGEDEPSYVSWSRRIDVHEGEEYLAQLVSRDRLRIRLSGLEPGEQFEIANGGRKGLFWLKRIDEAIEVLPGLFHSPTTVHTQKTSGTPIKVKRVVNLLMTVPVFSEAP